MSNKLHYNSRCIFFAAMACKPNCKKESCLVVFFFRRLCFQTPISPPTPLMSQVQLIEFRIKIHPGVKSPIPPPLLSFICYCNYHPSPPLCHASAERIKKPGLGLLQFISSFFISRVSLARSKFREGKKSAITDPEKKKGEITSFFRLLLHWRGHSLAISGGTERERER